MKTSLGLLLAVVAFTSPLTANVSLATDRLDERPVRIIQTNEAKFPHEMTARGVREGEVRAVLLVDADGKLADCLVTAYSHPEFAVELLNAVRSWEYEPARQNGEATAQRLQIVFHFNQRGAIVSMLPAMAVSASMNRFLPKNITELVSKANQLDRVPAVLERVTPRHPGKSITPPATSGSAQIDFYIDSEGRPRMPVVLRATHVEFAAAAADALVHWRFEPPTVGGRPVAVRMVQEFLF